MRTNKLNIIWVVFFSMVIALTAGPQIVLAHQHAENHFYLVSLGVGDPDLITLRAINTIKASDVIVCRNQTQSEFAEYLQGKTILDQSMAGWRKYRKDCSSIKDPKERAECQKSAESRAQLIKTIRAAVEAGKTVSVFGQRRHDDLRRSIPLVP